MWTDRGSITIPTYRWGPDDVNPHFQWTHGRPIYPYPMQDNLSREKRDRTYSTMLLENEYLRVTVIPELGGHVHSVFDKTTEREMFYVNQVVKPGLIGLRGAWISGGIEFNTGPHGHTVTCVSPVSCRFVDYDDGSRAIAIGNIERVFRTQWVVVVRLRPGRKFLEERVRIYNPTSCVQPYYFWNCTAVPNTDGMRFMYPMTLGTDHAGTTFFRWPIDKGVDLSWSKNYRKPSSIFAYECDQDFFGSYDFDIDYGVVAYADHHALPGKKAWTWGRGPEGVAAMATLTDDGTWYNEVQTGPLRTQADYGLLQPHQTIEWEEWWYPVHGIGGYEFANRDIAVNVAGGTGGEPMTFKIIGTGTWPRAVCGVTKDGREIWAEPVSISPHTPAIAQADRPIEAPFTIRIDLGEGALVEFIYPLPLPKREPPDLEALENPMKTARDHWAAGVLADKQSKPLEARQHFEKALELDADFAPAFLSLAILDLESGLPQNAEPRLRRILERDADNGWAHYYLAEALLQRNEEEAALQHAWKAARDRATDSLGLGLAGMIHLRRGQWPNAVSALERAVDKDGEDLINRNLLAIALGNLGRPDEALDQLARVLDEDPLDPVATYGLAAAATGQNQDGSAIMRRLRREPQTALEMAALFYRMNPAEGGSVQVLRDTSLANGARATPITYYYAAVFEDLTGPTPDGRSRVNEFLDRAASISPDHVFPDRLETIRILEHAAELRPNDWRIPYYLGCLYLAHYRKKEAVEAWRKALSLGGEYSVLHRNLAVTRWKLDDNVEDAISHFEKAIELRPDDQTLYRDLATLYQKTDRWAEARDLLEKTLPFKQYRGDVVELLARTYHHLGEDEKAAQLLDARTFHQWEGQRSLYNIYKDVHLALGKKALEAKNPGEAVAEFRRSLEYPDNLGVGRPENVREAEQHFWLGRALSALGQKADAAEAWRRAAAEGSRQPDDFPAQAAKMLKGIERE